MAALSHENPLLFFPFEVFIQGLHHVLCFAPTMIQLKWQPSRDNLGFSQFCPHDAATMTIGLQRRIPARLHVIAAFPFCGSNLNSSKKGGKHMFIGVLGYKNKTSTTGKGEGDEGKRNQNRKKKTEKKKQRAEREKQDTRPRWGGALVPRPLITVPPRPDFVLPPLPVHQFAPTSLPCFPLFQGSPARVRRRYSDLPSRATLFQPLHASVVLVLCRSLPDRRSVSTRSCRSSPPPPALFRSVFYDQVREGEPLLRSPVSCHRMGPPVLTRASTTPAIQFSVLSPCSRLIHSETPPISWPPIHSHPFLDCPCSIAPARLLTSGC